jgi:hypothetical protein
MITLSKVQKANPFLCLIALGILFSLSRGYQSAAKNNEQIIDWDKVRIACEAHVKDPSPENAKAFLCTLPKDKPENEKGDKSKTAYYIYINYSVWKSKVLAGDRHITEAVFRLIGVGDGALAQELEMILSTLAQINPRLFLEILYEYRNAWYVKHIGYPVIGTNYDDPKDRISELEMRIEALESVKTVKYSELRDECIRKLREAIWKISKDKFAMRVGQTAYK